MNDEDKLRALLVEYQNTAQLYNTVLTVGYQRLLALVALHGVLLIGAFTVSQQWEQIAVAITGVLLGVFTLIVSEHFAQIFLLRVFQALEIETHINSFFSSNENPLLTTFKRSEQLLIGKPTKGSISFDNLGQEYRLPKGFIGTKIHAQHPFFVERTLCLFVFLMWCIVCFRFFL
jgi:hypothetical protein